MFDLGLDQDDNNIRLRRRIQPDQDLAPCPSHMLQCGQRFDAPMAQRHSGRSLFMQMSSRAMSHSLFPWVLDPCRSRTTNFNR